MEVLKDFGGSHGHNKDGRNELVIPRRNGGSRPDAPALPLAGGSVGRGLCGRRSSDSPRKLVLAISRRRGRLRADAAGGSRHLRQ